MTRSLLKASLRVLALLVVLATLLTPAIASSPAVPPASQAIDPGGPLCCGGG
jgi:hypothetical protein